MQRTLARLLSKRMTIPQLSPTHTKARVVRWEVPSKRGVGPRHQVSAYDPVMVLECSSDMITEGFRDRVDDRPLMIVETQDEGDVMNLDDGGGMWLPVGTVVGYIDDGDPVDGDWTWQAYLHHEEDSSE